MSDDAFDDLEEAVDDALALDRDERLNLRGTRIQAPGSAKERMEAIEGVKRGLENMKGGEGKSAEKFFQEFFASEDIPEYE